LTLTHPLFYQIPDTASFFASMSWYDSRAYAAFATQVIFIQYCI
jgi:hypothetical protein